VELGIIRYNETARGLSVTFRAKRPSREDANQLIKRVAYGDMDALRAIYDAYSSGVYSLAFRRLGDAGTAEEVVQDVFLRVWHAAPQWNESRGPFESWLFVVTRNLIYDRLRDKQRQGHMVTHTTWDVMDDVPMPDLVSDTIIDTDTTAHLLEGLSREQREIVTMIYVDGFTTAEVAQMKAIPQGTVKSRLRLALDHLRRHLTAKEVE